MTIFDEQYKAFEEVVIPEDAFNNQRKDMEMSFYSGAAALVSCIMSINETCDTNEAGDKEFNSIVRNIYDKMGEFIEE